MTRAKFESLVSPLVEKTINCCQQALEDAKVTTSDIKEVILTGGMTQMPLVLPEMMWTVQNDIHSLLVMLL